MAAAWVDELAAMLAAAKAVVMAAAWVDKLAATWADRLAVSMADELDCCVVVQSDYTMELRKGRQRGAMMVADWEDWRVV